jgi:hypothetical protein
MLDSRDIRVDWGTLDETILYRRAVDSIRGLQNVGENVKNFRLRILVFVRDIQLCSNLISLFGYFQNAGSKSENLLMCGIVENPKIDSSIANEKVRLEMRFLHRSESRRKSRESHLRNIGVDAFIQQVYAANLNEGIRALLQLNFGFPFLRANLSVFGYLDQWNLQTRKSEEFVSSIRDSLSLGIGTCIVRDWECFHSKEEYSGSIDVWWLSDDGGLSILLPHLLAKNISWKNCKLRIMSSCPTEDAGILFGLLKRLRINAEIIPCDIQLSSEVSADLSAEFDTKYNELFSTNNIKWRKKETHFMLNLREEIRKYSSDNPAITFM